MTDYKGGFLTNNIIGYREVNHNSHLYQFG